MSPARPPTSPAGRPAGARSRRRRGALHRRRAAVCGALTLATALATLWLTLSGSAAALPSAPASARGPSTAAAGAEAPAGSYVPGEVIVGYGRGAAARLAAAESGSGGPVRVLRLPAGVAVQTALRRLRSSAGVSWAVPDYLAHAARVASPALGSLEAASTLAAPFVPENEGRGPAPGDWQALQWNYAPGPFGVEGPQAWGNLIADQAAGGRGVTVAVLDTGIAFRNWQRFRRSPGFDSSQFVTGHDFVDPGLPPLDHNGHGTFVAGEIAESTNVRYGLAGLAYGVKLMPVRVLDSAGEGDALTIAKGVRWAVNHHAQVINLSLEFPAAISAADVPELISALRYASRHHVLVVAAAGNDSTQDIPYPARAAGVVAVGATTEHGCLADYSNFGRHITLVAPGGGPDATLEGDPNCHPELPSGRDVFQVTLMGSSLQRFGIPSGYEGTSMATPEVSATAALVIASGVLGSHPTPAAVTARLRATTRQVGGSSDRWVYGAGLLDAAAATAPGGPGAVQAATSAHRASRRPVG